MNYLFYFGHPSQYLFLRETIRQLSLSGSNEVTILIKTKDVLEDLVRNDGFAYTNILTRPRGGSKTSAVLSLLKRIWFITPIILDKKPDLLIGTDASIAQLGLLFRINRITFIEDDYEVVKHLAALAYRATQTILCPDVCQVGSWTAKKVSYQGYMKLGYLHPAVFTPNTNIGQKYSLPKRFILIRLASLIAHHDLGIRGIDLTLLQSIIEVVEAKGIAVKISSEAQITSTLERYLLRIDPGDMHHVLFQSTLLVSDSQSMSVEAAMLGIPSIRYSPLVGKISVLEELEHTYGLTFGIRIGEKHQLLTLIARLIEQPDLTQLFQQRRLHMLANKINVSAFLLWFLENYPLSIGMMKTDTTFMERFK